MICTVEACWNGKESYQRVTIPARTIRGGNRFRVYAETWTRKAATYALDYLERHYNVARRNVRFKVR